MKAIKTLNKIILSSSSSILFIILGIIFLISIITSIKKHKKIGKTLLVAGWIFVILFIIIKFNSYLNKIIDNLINNIFMEIFFPNLAVYLIIVIIINIIFIYNIFKKNNISSTILFILTMCLMALTLEEIIKSDINVYDFNDVYSDNNLVVLIESTTIIFIIYIIINISKLCIKKLIKLSDENIKKEFTNKQSKPIFEPETEEELKQLNEKSKEDIEILKI